MTQPADDPQDTTGPSTGAHLVIADLDPNSTLATSPLRRALAALEPTPTPDKDTP
ncbi:hypothetical protein ACFC0S_16320 [Streptomyces sp. NPDC056084]|uniref:hypothetical protein n=1 Tax=unclassified Streptomyces TaxID=2593676 RepID=UPI0035E03A60